MSQAKQYIKENRDRFMDELFQLLRIPSISSNPEYKEDMYKAAECLKTQLIASGCDRAIVMDTDGHPVTYAEKIIDPAAPTILVYGHMDVQPVEPLALWKTEPFEPVIIDNKIYCRGANDDKGQAFMHLKAFEYVTSQNKLKCNIKFLIEGEEEIGSPSLEKFCLENKELLKADIILVSDTGMISEDVATITTGLRGLSYLDVEVTGPNHDLHSGQFGGAVANPLNELCKLMSKITDSENRIVIPGFYDNVIELSTKEREELDRAPFDEDQYKKFLDIDETLGEEGYTTPERTGIRPSFDLCGMWGGHTATGAKTVLPSQAFAKVSYRLVPNQTGEEIAEKTEKYLQSIAPKSIKLKVKYLHGGDPYVCPTDIPEYAVAERAFKTVFGHTPVPMRLGGSIPIISTFEKVLGIKSILMGFGLAEDAIHSPNESFGLNRFDKGIETIINFYQEFGNK